MPLSRADLDALVRRREAEARAATAAGVERILATPDPGARMRAYAELTRALAEDGDTLPPWAEERIAASLHGDADDGRGPAATAWEDERRRLAMMHVARPAAAAGYVALAVLPFVVAAVRWRMGFRAGLGMFLAPGWPLAGVVLALVVAGVLGRLAGRAASLERLAGLALAAFAAGVAGLAVAVAAI